MGEVEACSPAPCVGQCGARGPGSPVPWRECRVCGSGLSPQGLVGRESGWEGCGGVQAGRAWRLGVVT